MQEQKRLTNQRPETVVHQHLLCTTLNFPISSRPWLRKPGACSDRKQPLILTFRRSLVPRYNT